MNNTFITRARRFALFAGVSAANVMRMLLCTSVFSAVSLAPQCTGKASEKANSLSGRLATGTKARRALHVGEPQLIALQWADISLGGSTPIVQPLFDVKRLMALAQPVHAHAQQGALDIGGYLYNPESYISVEPRLRKLSNRAQLQLLPESPKRAWFGLLHAHTFSSDGIGDASDAFRMARDIAGLDFFALTDHSEYWWSKASPDWQRQLVLAQAETRPDFVALVGFEYSHPLHGHIVVLNSRQWTSALQTHSLASFYDWLAAPEREGALAIFAHPGFHRYRNWFDLAHFRHDPRVQNRMIGVETLHRNVWSKSLRGFRGVKSHLDEATESGWWLGTVASQDNHTPYWGVSDQSRLGVLMSDFSKDALLQALARRHFYSTQSPHLQMAVGLYEGGRLHGIMGDIVSREQLSSDDGVLKLRLFEPNPSIRPQKIEFYVNGRKERSLTFMDRPQFLSHDPRKLTRGLAPWLDALFNNGVVTRRPFEWALDIQASSDPDIFDVEVPLHFPACQRHSKKQHSRWSIVVRYYQGDRGELLTTSSPLEVRCS